MTERPVLICYDGSADARNAIDEAATLLGPRRAVVLDVAPVLTVTESFATIASAAPGVEIEDLNKAQAETVARDGAGHARASGFSAEARATVDSPTWEGIVEVADEIDAAVIVIGSRGLSGARELLAGSLSHEVAEHAGRPVLIVPRRNH